MTLTPIAWKIYYGDGAIRTSLDSWDLCEGDDLQCVIVFFAETYQTYSSSEQRYITENYREILHGCDYYWFDTEANRPFTGMAEDAVGKTGIKTGRTLSDDRFKEIYGRARRDKRWIQE